MYVDRRRRLPQLGCLRAGDDRDHQESGRSFYRNTIGEEVSAKKRTIVTKAVLGGDAGLLGAARVCRFWRRRGVVSLNAFRRAAAKKHSLNTNISASAHSSGSDGCIFFYRDKYFWVRSERHGVRISDRRSLLLHKRRKSFCRSLLLSSTTSSSSPVYPCGPQRKYSGVRSKPGASRTSCPAHRSRRHRHNSAGRCRYVFCSSGRKRVKRDGHVSCHAHPIQNRSCKCCWHDSGVRGSRFSVV